MSGTYGWDQLHPGESNYLVSDNSSDIKIRAMIRTAGISKGFKYIEAWHDANTVSVTVLSDKGAMLLHTVSINRHKAWVMAQSQLYTMGLVPHPCNPSSWGKDSSITVIDPQ